VALRITLLITILQPGTGNRGTIVVRRAKSKGNGEAQFEIVLRDVEQAEGVYNYITRRIATAAINPETQHFVDFDSLTPSQATGLTSSNAALLQKYWLAHPEDHNVLWVHQWSISTFLKKLSVIPITYLITYLLILVLFYALYQGGEPNPQNYTTDTPFASPTLPSPTTDTYPDAYDEHSMWFVRFALHKSHNRV